MPCRIGITADPEGLKKIWEDQVYGLTNWKILKENLTMRQAQDYESEYLRGRYNEFTGHPGSSGEPEDYLNRWVVYRFEYTSYK